MVLLRDKYGKIEFEKFTFLNIFEASDIYRIL